MIAGLLLKATRNPLTTNSTTALSWSEMLDPIPVQAESV
jgi:hypothetical protein